MVINIDSTYKFAYIKLRGGEIMNNCISNNSCIWCPCCRCRPPIIVRCPTGPTGATAPPLRGNI